MCYLVVVSSDGHPLLHVGLLKTAKYHDITSNSLYVVRSPSRRVCQRRTLSFPVRVHHSSTFPKPHFPHFPQVPNVHRSYTSYVPYPLPHVASSATRRASLFGYFEFISLFLIRSHKEYSEHSSLHRLPPPLGGEF